MERLYGLLRLWKENGNWIRSAAVIMIIIAAVLFYGLKGNNQSITIENGEGQQETSESAESEDADAGVIYIDIGGAVKKPGVYEMKPGDRVFQVIEKAGGLTRKADTAMINQAEEVKDGQKLTIPKRGDAGSDARTAPESAASGGSSAGSAGGKININTADAGTLEQITGVGPVTAQKIIEYREANGSFGSIEEIRNVSGIGEKTFEKMKGEITV